MKVTSFEKTSYGRIILTSFYYYDC